MQWCYLHKHIINACSSWVDKVSLFQLVKCSVSKLILYTLVLLDTHHRVEPDPTNIGGTLRGMSSENGRENSPLDPPGVELRIWRRWSVPTDIMTPVPKSNITGSHSKCNLKVKGVPALHGIKCSIASFQTAIM